MTALQRCLLRRLDGLKPGATMCPGRLSRDCGTTLAKARHDILILARAGRIALSQRGQSVTPDGLKGPFRVRLR
jgi:hypothetical protein